MMNKIGRAIILSFRDKVLRKVIREKTETLIWGKIELLYMTKSLTYRLCLKQQLYSFWMVENKFIVKELTNFHKIIDDLNNIKGNINDEGMVLLLSSLPYLVSILRIRLFMINKVLFLCMKSIRLWDPNNSQKWNIWGLMIVVKAWVSRGESGYRGMSKSKRFDK